MPFTLNFPNDLPDAGAIDDIPTEFKRDQELYHSSLNDYPESSSSEDQSEKKGSSSEKKGSSSEKKGSSSKKKSIVREIPSQPPLASTNRRNDWFIGLEKYIMDISDECRRYYTINSEISTYYRTLHDVLTLSIIFLPFLTSVLALVPIATKPSTVPLSISDIIIGILGLIGTLIGTLNKLTRYSDKSKIHRVAGNKYMKLNSTITEQLFLPVDVRYNGLEFERWCRQTFFHIKELTPYPNRRFIRGGITPSGKYNTHNRRKNIFFRNIELTRIVTPKEPVEPVESVDVVEPVVEPVELDEYLQHQLRRQKNSIFNVEWMV